jgi:sugar phosphate isomerase/epimerase
MLTRTGNFPVGFRPGWAAWQKDLPALTQWAKNAGFEAIDLETLQAEDLNILRAAGLKLGTVDLIDFGQLMQNEAQARQKLIAQNVAYVKQAAAWGAKTFFACMIPGDPGKKRAENYALAVESFAPIAAACAAEGASLAIEGWPGPAPYYPALCCTPETCRMLIRDLGPGMGLNYDPSHLIRLGVDHIRFLREFLPHIRHVHAKDTELLPEAAYEYGMYQGSPQAQPVRFGELVWRYTIPGSGQTRWRAAFKILREGGYRGAVSVELEDADFNGTPEGEKAGFEHSLAFLRGA